MLSVPGFRQVPAGWWHVSIFTATIRLDSGLVSLKENQAQSRQGFLLVGAELRENMVKVSSRLVRLTVQIVFLCFVLVGGAPVKDDGAGLFLNDFGLHLTWLN